MGVISGIVTKNGYPARGVKVSAAVGGLLAGGHTKEAVTDHEGRFLLQWSSNTDAEKIFCDGREVMRDVKNGRNNVHISL